MNEMKLKQDYQNTFDEVHAPANLYGKVMNMSEMKRNRQMSVIRKLTAAASIALIIFVGSNGIAYATTGNSLLKTVMVYFDGSGYKVDLEEKTGEDGVIYYEGTFEVEDGPGAVFITDNTDAIMAPYEVMAELTEIIEENGKLYLVDGDIKLDITKDLEDGQASGSYMKEGILNHYEISGDREAWDVSISNEE